MQRRHPARPYVYVVLIDGVERYVGKGRDSRRDHHVRTARSIARRRAAGEVVVTTEWNNRLTAAWLDGAEVTTLVLAECDTDAEAFDREVAEIAARPAGQLWNGDKGGAGGNTEGMGVFVAEENVLCYRLVLLVALRVAESVQ